MDSATQQATSSPIPVPLPRPGSSHFPRHPGGVGVRNGVRASLKDEGQEHEEWQSLYHGIVKPLNC